MIGGVVDLDNNPVSKGVDDWKLDGHVSCYQLYDVALNEQQLKRSMEICDPKGQNVIF